jgi:hypothetical protein
MGGRCRCVVATELPEGFEKFGIGGVPQAAAVQVGAQFAYGGDELAGSHFWNQFGQFRKAG